MIPVKALTSVGSWIEEADSEVEVASVLSVAGVAATRRNACLRRAALTYMSEPAPMVCTRKNNGCGHCNWFFVNKKNGASAGGEGEEEDEKLEQRNSKLIHSKSRHVA